MDTQDPQVADRARIATMAALLDAGTVIAVASGAQGAVATLAILRADAAPAWILVVVLAAPALWYAWRVRLDARLFAALASPPADPADTLERRLAALDAALASFALRRRPDGAPRSLDDRLRGARTLLIRQAIVGGVQLVLTLLLALSAAG